MADTKEAIYFQLRQLITEMPPFTPPLDNEAHQWTGRAYALASKVCDEQDKTILRKAISELSSDMFHGSAVIRVSRILYRALAIAELDAPVQAKGSFIAAGGVFDALASLSKILGSAAKDALVVDPYIDEKVLTDFAVLLAESFQIRLLSDAATVKPSLLPAVKRWKAQYARTRLLDARLAPPRALHDRVVIIDSKDVWVLTQSLNSFAHRAPASIVKVDAQTAPLKVSAYNHIFASASSL